MSNNVEFPQNNLRVMQDSVASESEKFRNDVEISRSVGKSHTQRKQAGGEITTQSLNPLSGNHCYV